MDFIAGPARDGLLVLAGLCAAIVGAVRAVRAEEVPPGRATRLWLFAPPALIALAFFMTGKPYAIWVPAVTAVTLALAGAGLGLLSRPVGDEPALSVRGPVLAVLIAVTALFQLGALLTVRLVVTPDPRAPFAAGLSAHAWGEAWPALVQPVLGLVVFVAGLAWAARPEGSRTGIGAVIRRGAASIGRRATGTEPLERVHSRRLSSIVCVAVAAPFVLPLFTGGGDAALTFGPLATPEYGKLVLLAGLALFVARDSFRYEAIDVRATVREIRQTAGGLLRPAALKALYRAGRFAYLPLLLFALVAAGSAVRHDFGTLVPAVVATFGVTWAATRQNVAQRPDGATGGRVARAGRFATRAMSAYRVFLAIAILFVAGAATLLGTDYVGERGRVWTDPWASRWDSGCAVVAAPPDVTVPAGRVACRRSLLADAESERSQVARAVAATADGGLWGRGLRDTASAAVTAGETDFVLAVLWSKLGGLVVLAAGALIALLGAGLARAAAPAASLERPPMVTLFAAGLGAMIVGQFLFVLAATANVVPHTGIPAPLLSRGGQATLALLAGIALTLALTRDVPGGVPPAPVRVDPTFAVRPPSRIAGALAPVLAAAAIVAGLTSAPPDPATCSTDLIAYQRTRIELRFGDRPGYVLDRDTRQWRLAPGADLDGLVPEDLTGLLRVGGGPVGVIEQSYPQIVDGTIGADLGRRLWPAGRDPGADGSLALTLRPGWQHQVAAALRSDGPEGPLAGAVVVLDATTGAVLVSASAPAGPAPAGPAAGAVDPREAERFADAHDHYVQPTVDDRLADDRGDPQCPRRTPDANRQAGCWRWSYAQPATAAGEAAERDLRRYIGGQTKPPLPSPDVNRALGQWYGLGSTFKVVIAATYLARPGTSPDDLLPAPATVQLTPQRSIRNSGGGSCPGASNGKITLTAAVAVSCNTAFVLLAQRLGWPAIAAQAKLFGLRVGKCLGRDPFFANALTGAVDTCVPATADAVSIGNDVLGGGAEVQGTPMAMATVMAAIANGGRLVQPVLVSEVTDPATGAPRRTAQAPPAQAFDPAIEPALREALQRTAIDGTAARLDDETGRRLWVKTGTHDLVPAGTSDDKRYVREHSWMVGFMDTARGPLAFAVVVEAPSPAAGSKRVRYLVEAMCTAIGDAT